MEKVDKWMPCFITFLDYVLNDSPKPFLPATRGLRQGDPLSLFLFTLVVDALHQILREGESQTSSKDSV